MKFRQLSNEKGITLVELLAALSLFAVIIALSSTLIVQLVNNGEKASADVLLKQETNILLSELRNQYYEGESKLCFQNDKIFVSNYEIFSGDDPLMIQDGCISNSTETPLNQEPLSLTLTTSNDSGQQFVVETAWDKKKTYTINQGSGYAEEVVENDNTKCTDEGNTTTCVFEGNTKVSTNDVISNDSTITIENGSAIFTNEITIGQDVNVKIKSENVTFGRDIILDHKASLIMEVSGDSTFEGNILLIQNNHQITIYGDAVFNGDITIGKNNSIITVKGDATFNGDLTFEGNNAEIRVNGNATCLEENDLGRNRTIRTDQFCSKSDQT